MSKINFNDLKTLSYSDLSNMQKRRSFFTGPEAAKLISDFTGEACNAFDLKDLAHRSVPPSIRFTERCLLPIFGHIEEPSKELSAAQRQAYKTSQNHDQIIELHGKKYLLRGLRDPLELMHPDWVWPVDAFTPLKLGHEESSTLLANCIIDPRPINANELAKHPISAAPVYLGSFSEDQAQLRGEGWGAEFFDDFLIGQLEETIEIHELNEFSHLTRIGLSRLITPDSLGSAQLEVGYTFDQISALTRRRSKPEEMTFEKPLSTKSKNLWQNFMRRIVRAELGKKFESRNKQQTVRTLISRVERKEEQKNIQPESDFPSERWIIKNLF